MSVVPRAALGFGDLVERFLELRKHFLLKCMVVVMKKMKIKSNQDQGRSGQAPHGSLSVESWKEDLFPKRDT